MKVVKIKHTQVKPNGTFKNRSGAVETKPLIRMSRGEGCGLDTCHCSDGYWLMIGAPRTDKGVVTGLRVDFDSKEEMDEFFKEHELKG